MRNIRLAFLAAFSLALPLSIAVVPAASTQAASAGLRVITTFHPGDFPESLAIGRQGNLYVSLGFLGEIVKVTPGGQHQLVAKLPTGDGLLTGLAFDPSGRLYVADATFQARPVPPGIFRIGTSGLVTRVATLPKSSFPNGLAFHDGYLYISDSSLGVIWRLAPDGHRVIWLRNALLAPTANIGANGLAFWHRSLYVAVADSGMILRVPLLASGRAGTPVVVAQAKMLQTADGIAFDIRGNMYIAVNFNRLVRLAPDGTLTKLAVREDGLNYPTMPAFGTTCTTRTALFITNGAFHKGIPTIVTLDVGGPGLPLP